MFCDQCGRFLAPGEVCNCTAANNMNNTGRPNAYQSYPQQGQRNTNNESRGFFEVIKNRMGIGDEELNKGNAYETGKKIIPDCVNANEGEVPVKQYHIAELRNRVLGIPYAKAKGRIQVTNKRVIFRAPGRCFAGRTTLQHEFAIDELAGIEARREYVFSGMDLILSILASIVGGMFSVGVISLLGRGSIGFMSFLAFLLGAAGCVPFALLKKKWLLKILCLSGSYMPLFVYGSALASMNYGAAFFGGFFIFLGIIPLLASLLCLIYNVVRPNLVLSVKAKASSDAINIRRKKLISFMNKVEEEHTGYTEIIPAKDAERCIREINAMIIDIQKLGDFGIEKWKA